MTGHFGLRARPGRPRHEALHPARRPSDRSGRDPPPQSLSMTAHQGTVERPVSSSGGRQHDVDRVHLAALAPARLADDDEDGRSVAAVMKCCRCRGPWAILSACFMAMPSWRARRSRMDARRFRPSGFPPMLQARRQRQFPVKELGLTETSSPDHRFDARCGGRWPSRALAANGRSVFG